MKFRKGQKSLVVPPMGELLEAALDIDGVEIRLSVVHMEQVQEHRKKFAPGTAWPTMIALARGASEVHLWPTPHKAGVVKLRYFPPIEVI